MCDGKSILLAVLASVLGTAEAEELDKGLLIANLSRISGVSCVDAGPGKIRVLLDRISDPSLTQIEGFRRELVQVRVQLYVTGSMSASEEALHRLTMHFDEINLGRLDERSAGQACFALGGRDTNRVVLHDTQNWLGERMGSFFEVKVGRATLEVRDLGKMKESLALAVGKLGKVRGLTLSFRDYPDSLQASISKLKHLESLGVNEGLATKEFFAPMVRALPELKRLELSPRLFQPATVKRLTDSVGAKVNWSSDLFIWDTGKRAVWKAGGDLPKDAPLAVDPDGMRLATISPGYGVEVFDLDSGSRVWRDAHLSIGARRVEFSPKGKRVVAIGESLVVFDSESGDPLLQTSISRTKGLNVHGIAWNTSEDAIAVAYQEVGKRDRSRVAYIRIRDSAYEQRELRLPEGPVSDLAFSPLGNELIVLSASGQLSHIRIDNGVVTSKTPMPAGEGGLILRTRSGKVEVLQHVEGVLRIARPGDPSVHRLRTPNKVVRVVRSAAGVMHVVCRTEGGYELVARFDQYTQTLCDFQRIPGEFNGSSRDGKRWLLHKLPQ